MSGQREILESVTPDHICIPRNNKTNKTPASSVLRNELIGDTVNPRKISQESNVIDIEIDSQHKTPQTFLNREYYEVDADKDNRFTDGSRTGNDDCVRKLDIEQENEDDE